MKEFESNKPAGFNFGIMKSKKGAMPVLLSGLAVVGLIFIVGLIGLFTGFIKLGDNAPNELSIRETNQGTQERLEQDMQTGPTKVMQLDESHSFHFIAVNPNDDSGSPDWNAVSVKVQKADTQDALLSYTTDSDGTEASAALSVGYGPTYNAWVVASKNATGSAGPFSLDTTKLVDPYTLTIDVPDFDHIRMSNCYDEINRGKVWNSQDASAAGTTIDLATTGATFKSTTNNTATALGNSEVYKQSCDLDVADYKQWGDVRNFIAFDADSSDYSEVTYKFDGRNLDDVGKGVLHPDDQGYLSAYEKLFHLDANIKATNVQRIVQVETKSTGTVDADMKERFLAEVYRVKEDGRGVEKRIFDSAGNELYQAPAAEITHDIS